MVFYQQRILYCFRPITLKKCFLLQMSNSMLSMLSQSIIYLTNNIQLLHSLCYVVNYVVTEHCHEIHKTLTILHKEYYPETIKNSSTLKCSLNCAQTSYHYKFLTIRTTIQIMPQTSITHSCISYGTRQLI